MIISFLKNLVLFILIIYFLSLFIMIPWIAQDLEETKYLWDCEDSANKICNNQ